MKAWVRGALLAGLATCAHAQEMASGQWESKTTISVNGKPIAIPDAQGRTRQALVDRNCLAAKDAGDIRTALERSMTANMPGCHVSRWDYAAGMLKATLTCDASAPGGAGSVNISGPVSARQYDLTGNGHFQHPQMGPMTSGFRYQGRYVGACKS
ncbi:hypothetical protein R82526_04081 [Ralstonia mannitolilytica]|uniref:DUF3617 domain-containing protein n=1 Tax=Ralstonia mannitolilytica TaxID=105219 RepID=UPI0007AFF15B|nr:DUF3617 family protein [Ralstonia mannitolilytica]ANA33588.1 hypothetical protein VZ52_09355 [Ralstonia mannitolilytica]CAJ0693998.1 hypothetical protein R82526_04081 [Ralstonia mannitolilytica]CAJ0888443.1 hypothetical protein R76727_04015 [Ralstonia mannitolilytica]